MKDDKCLSARKQPVQDRSQAIVAAINEAAIQVFAQNGYHLTTTTMIAKRAGVSIGSLYQYYPNKDSIIVTIMNLMLDAGLEDVIDALSMVDADRDRPMDILRIFTETMVDAYLQSAPLLKVVFDDAPQPANLIGRFKNALQKAADHLETHLAGQEEQSCNLNTSFAKLYVYIVNEAARWYASDALHVFSREEIVESITRMISGFSGYIEKAVMAGQGALALARARDELGLRKNVVALFEFIIDRGMVSISECETSLPQSRRTIQRGVKILIEAGLVRAVNSGATDPRKRYEPTF